MRPSVQIIGHIESYHPFAAKAMIRRLEMIYSAEILSMILSNYGIKTEYRCTSSNDFMEVLEYKILNTEDVSGKWIGEIADKLDENTIVKLKDRDLLIEMTYDTPPRPFSAYSNEITRSKALMPVFIGESMDGYEIADLAADGNILISGNHAKARSNMLNTALSSLRLSKTKFRMLESDAKSDFRTFIADIEKARKDKMETIVIMKDLPSLLCSPFGTKAEKMLYTARNDKHLHFIAVSSRASADIITDIIKKAFPIMITSKLSSKMNSRIILGEEGAELLYGEYDYLMRRESKIIHVHGAKTP